MTNFSSSYVKMASRLEFPPYMWPTGREVAGLTFALVSATITAIGLLVSQPQLWLSCCCTLWLALLLWLGISLWKDRFNPVLEDKYKFRRSVWNRASYCHHCSIVYFPGSPPLTPEQFINRLKGM
jgi:hypothetical protein